MLAFRPLFDAHVEVAEIVTLGRTPLGERRVVNILGGWFRGERLAGRVRPGGADWQTVGDDGAARLDARYTLETDGGALVQVTSQGLRHGPPEVLARLAAGEAVDPGALLLPDRAALRDRGARPRLAEPRHRDRARRPAADGPWSSTRSSCSEDRPAMLLIEHATVITLDRERRILADGSVLVDGRDIVQVGPARDGAPAPSARPRHRRPAPRRACPASWTPTSTCRST